MIMASAPQTQNKVHAAVESIISMFEDGTLPERIATTMIRAKETAAPSARWSLGNRLLMLAAKTEDARGYRQWQDAGRHVVKGARALYILAPRTVKVKEQDETGREVERPKCIGFLAVPVFKVEDTDGEPLPQVDYTPATFPPLMDTAARLGVKVTWKPGDGRAYGRFSPRENAITLHSHDANVFFHELAHAAHNGLHPLTGGQVAGQEIVAETVAAVLCKLYGLDGYLFDAREYVAGYGQGNAGRAVLKVLAEVEQVLALILDGREVQGRAA